MSDDATSAPATGGRWKMPKWGWALFAVSLALNLLVLGSVIGMGFSGHGHGKRGDGMRHVLRSLPDDQRDNVRAILKKHRQDVRPLRRALREKHKDLEHYLKSETVSPAEVERRLDAIALDRQGIQTRLRPLILELSGDLPPEVRSRVVGRLIGGRRGHRRKWRRRRE